MRKKNKTRAKYLVVFMTVCVCMFLAACGDAKLKRSDRGTADSPYNAAFVFVIANNNPVLDLQRVEEFSGLSAHPGSTYSFILGDSTPSEIYGGAIPDFTKKGYTREMISRVEQSVQADLTGKVSQAAPDADEVDMARSIQTAVRVLRANWKEDDENILVLYGSGISTSGLIDMSDVSLYNLDVEASAEAVHNTLDLDMEGIDVVFYCAGDVSGKQAELNDTERKNLMEFYEALFKKSGSSNVNFREELPPAGSYDFPYVVTEIATCGSKSELSEASVEYSDLSEGADVADIFEAGEGGMIAFRDEVSFVADSTELLNPEEADRALSSVYEYMMKQENVDLLIIGTTSSAGDDEASSIVFSEERADVVKQLLARKGIPMKRLHSMGCGFSCTELYIPDKNMDGSLNEKIACQNRAVYIMDRNSDTAARIYAEMEGKR